MKTHDVRMCFLPLEGQWQKSDDTNLQREVMNYYNGVMYDGLFLDVGNLRNFDVEDMTLLLEEVKILLKEVTVVQVFVSHLLKYLSEQDIERILWTIYLEVEEMSSDIVVPNVEQLDMIKRREHRHTVTQLSTHEMYKTVPLLEGIQQIELTLYEDHKAKGLIVVPSHIDDVMFQILLQSKPRNMAVLKYELNSNNAAELISRSGILVAYRDALHALYFDLIHYALQYQAMPIFIESSDIHQLKTIGTTIFDVQYLNERRIQHPNFQLFPSKHKRRRYKKEGRITIHNLEQMMDYYGTQISFNEVDKTINPYDLYHIFRQIVLTRIQ